MHEHTFVGKPLPRKDAFEKAAGKALFSPDLTLPGMLFGKILRSPYVHARILSISAQKARRLPGVKAVITAEDTSGELFGLTIMDMPILAKSKARFAGEPVAAVAAVDKDTAFEALDLIEVGYEELPAVSNPLKAMEEGTPLVHEDLLNYKLGFFLPPAGDEVVRYGNVCSHIKVVCGDMDKAMEEAYLIVEDMFETQREHQCYLEPHSAVASLDATGKITVWASQQGVFAQQALLSQVLNMPPNKIRVISPYVGGGFGGKANNLVAHICALLAKASNKPVKLVLTREEEFVAGRPRHPAIIEMKTAAAKDGILLARQAKMIFDTGAYSFVAPWAMGVAASFTQGVYRIPHVRFDGFCVYTNKMGSGPYSGFGTISLAFASECQMDVIAERLGMDPLEIRAKNALEEGNSLAVGQLVPGGAPVKESLSHIRKTGCWQRGKSGRKAVGLSCVAQASGETYCTSGAMVKINPDATVGLIIGGVDMGQGSVSNMAQIIAEELGIGMEDIVITPADTDSTPYDFQTTASRLTFTLGKAVQLAAQDAKEQLLHMAAERLEANMSDLELKGGRISVKGSPEKGIALSELALASVYHSGGPIIGKGSISRPVIPFNPDIAKGFIHSQLLAIAYSTHLAEIELDHETGKIQLTNHICVSDCGFAINPMDAQGQMIGGTVRGMGFALTEDYIFDERGLPFNTSFTNYGIPLAVDIPEIQPIIIEEAKEEGPYGSKGFGEPSLIGVAPAVANALYNALGIRIKSLPITPGKIVEALENC